MVIEASVEPTVQALLVYLRERDQQRDREVAELRAELAQARADLVEHAAELADTRTALETARQEVGQLRAELQQAQERLLALEAPRQEPDTSLGFTSGPADGLGAEPAQEPPETDHAPRRPWWRFW